MKFIFINDDLFLEKDSVIQVTHRGFLFGDGVFETCKILDKKIIESVINKKFKQKSKIINRIDKKYLDFINLCKTNLMNRSMKLIKNQYKILSTWNN